jgi:molecular chaperone GrpE (heat shock protein)
MADNTEVQEKLEELLKLFRSRIERDDVQGRAFDQLYEEMRQYKEDFLYQAEKPFLLDLLLFYDSLSWFQQALGRKDVSLENISDSFQYLMDEFLELLYRRDVVPCEGSDKFDVKTQKAVRVIPSENGEEDGQIQSVLKRGFVRGNRLLRPEEVVVYRNSRE